MNFGLLVYFLLGCSDAVKLHTHILNLLGLSVIDVGLASNAIVALFYLTLRALEFLCHVTLGLLGLCKLDFNVSKRILELLILNFAEA